MTSREDHLNDLSHYAAAIACWENEGGNSRSLRTNTGAMTSNNVGSMGMAESPAGQKDDTGTSGNLMAKGIIDPTKVVRAALQGAASVAGLLITTEAEVPRKQAAAPAMPGGSMDF